MAKQHSHSKHAPVAYVLDVDMGYGHARAAHSLRDVSGGEVITSNSYKGISKKERGLWKQWRQAYETISRLRPVPVVGTAAWSIAEKLQEIPEFYPRRDLSKRNLAIRQAYRLVRKQGLGKGLVARLNENPLPAVCTHPIPAFALEEHEYLGDIWCVPTDADIARAWAAEDPHRSRIKYFCANGRQVERLQLYGVPRDRLFLTGFPLPKELIGDNAEACITNLLARIHNLDPEGVFVDRYLWAVDAELDTTKCTFPATHPLTITYAVGGAGAQRAIGKQILSSLSWHLKRNELHLNLVAGTRSGVKSYFEQMVKELKLHRVLDKSVHIVYEPNRANYFSAFNEVLKTTDVLWTKPSELSFYAALGIPIIMAPPLGRQEEFNAAWLTYVGAGVAQQDPRYTNEWLFDWLNSGGLARAAWNGYLEAPRNGTYLIEDLVRGNEPELKPPPLIV